MSEKIECTNYITLKLCIRCKFFPAFLIIHLTLYSLYAIFSKGYNLRKKKKGLFDLSLKELRKKIGYTQEDITAYKQASVSKIEARKDIKISTLIEYINCMGLDVVIKAVKINPEGREIESYTLLQTRKNITTRL